MPPLYCIGQKGLANPLLHATDPETVACCSLVAIASNTIGREQRSLKDVIYSNHGSGEAISGQIHRQRRLTDQRLGTALSNTANGMLSVPS